MAFTFAKSTTLAAASLVAALSVLPMNAAEARNHRNGWLAAGVVGGALLGGALLAPRAHARPIYGHDQVYGNHVYSRPVYVDGPECFVVRQRVWDEYRGRHVHVRRTVCE